MATNTCKYWWLNTNKARWDVLEHPEGYKEQEMTYIEGNKRRVYRYFADVRVGDMVIGYQTPTRKVLAIYKITKEIHRNIKNEEVIEFEILMNKLKHPISWNDIKCNSGLKNSEPVKINNRGSLFRLTPEEFNIILSLAGESITF